MNPQAGRAVRALLLGAALVLATGTVAMAESPAPSQSSTNQQTPPAGATLTASPSVISATVEPGGEGTATLTLRAGQGLDITIDAQGLGQSVEDGGFSFVGQADDTSPYTARTYLSVDPATFRLDAGDTQEVNVTVKLPPDAKDGAHYALLRVNGQPSAGDGNVGIGVALGVSVLVTTPGATATLKGALEDVSVGELVPGQPVTVTATVANTGDAHYGAVPNQVYQSAVLRNADGAALASARQTQSGNSIIPTFGRAFELSLEPAQPLGPGTYTVDVEVGLEDGTVLDKETATLGTPQGSVLPATAGPTDDSSQLLQVVLLGAGLAALLIGVVLVGGRMLRRRPSAV